MLFLCSFFIAFSCSLLAPAPFSSGARKKEMEKKKNSGCSETLTLFSFCMPPVSRFCAGARSWRVYFFLVFFLSCVSVWKWKQSGKSYLFSLFSWACMLCVHVWVFFFFFFLTSVSYISFMGCKFQGSLLFRYLELKSELWGERRKNGVIAVS